MNPTGRLPVNCPGPFVGQDTRVRVVVREPQAVSNLETEIQTFSPTASGRASLRYPVPTTSLFTHEVGVVSINIVR